MKNKKQISNAEVILRLLGGVALIIAGITISVLHFMKVAPANWESSPFLFAITFVWAYAGFFLGPIVMISGAHVMRLDYALFRWAEKKGWF